MPPRSLCTCSRCLTHVSTDTHGNHIHGRYLASSTISDHRRQDVEREENAQHAAQEENAQEAPAESDTSNNPPRILAWLFLKKGASRTTCNTLLCALDFIISLMIQIFFDILRSFSLNFTSPILDIPHDIRTIFNWSRHLNVDISRTVCCSTCFTRYHDSDNIPTYCTWRASRRSQPCNEPLWKQHQTAAKGSKLVPRSFFNMQSFKAWLEFFLFRPEIEGYLEAAFQKNRNIGDIPDIMRDVDDSPIWKSFQDYFRTRYNLIFGIYIDWFNPYTNKIGGKQVSCGAIVLYCMNLPIEVRFLPENVFIAGMTPIPSLPTAVTLSHIMSVIIEMISVFGPNGPNIPTYAYPTVVPTFGDLSFLEHVTSKEIEHYRNGATVRAQAQQWKMEETVTKKQKLATASGVRWTPMHNLPYWDPVKHVILGVLEHQLRDLWGIGRTKQKQDNSEEDDDDDGNLTEDSIKYEDDEDEALPEPSIQKEQSMEIEEENIPPIPNTIYAMDEDDDDDDDAYFEIPEGAFKFSSAQMTLIRNAWVSRLPKNLGEMKHGKLKAHKYLMLFTVFLPLVMPELWCNGEDFEKALLDSYTHLIAATNIIAAYTTSNIAADTFTDRFVHYRKSIRILFPYVSSKPNHHYAMHNGPLLKIWGPLTLLSEFPGERMNGIFQKVKTSYREDDMDLTMFRKICQQGRFRVWASAQKSTQTPLSSLANILYPTTSSIVDNLDGYGTAAFLMHGTPLDDEKYNQLLAYIRTISNQQWFSYLEAANAPHHSWVLPRFVKKLHNFKQDEKMFSHIGSHIGNSAIQFCNPRDSQERYCGFIQEIWEIPLHGVVQIFLLVHPYQQLSDADAVYSPYTTRPELCAELVYTAPSPLVAII
ncbi:hypothetical protein BDZ89DRAFT_1094884 [Hymenopellis radicata]|nr:hypothetical protein BDZ89DRAFT_1094884 [Hymenopellis radicata]